MNKSICNLLFFLKIINFFFFYVGKGWGLPLDEVNLQGLKSSRWSQWQAADSCHSRKSAQTAFILSLLLGIHQSPCKRQAPTRKDQQARCWQDRTNRLSASVALVLAVIRHLPCSYSCTSFLHEKGNEPPIGDVESWIDLHS